MHQRTRDIQEALEPVLDDLRSLPETLSGFREAVILTDYDRHGGYLAGRCERTARSFGLRPNLEFRRRIRKATFRELSHIEGLDAYVRNLGRRQAIR